jgi:hypothetical protein
MHSNEKGNMRPEIPSSTWAFMSLARDHLEVSGLHRIFGVDRSQISRWTKNPAVFDDAQRNPIDRLRLLFERMVEAGEAAAVLSMISELSRPLGGPVEVCAPVTPERETLLDELMDIHPACTEHAQSIRRGDELRTVEHWEVEAIRQIREGTEAYRKGLAR